MILAFSLVSSILFHRLKLATIIAYMAVGVIIGPHVFNIVSQPENISFIAEYRQELVTIEIFHSP